MMNEYLATVYNTGAAADSFEKTAQSELLMKLAEEEGIDLSGLSEEQMGALADQIVSDNQGGEAAAADEGTDIDAGVEADEEAQAKFAEADFLGRVMAHSYTQELNKIAAEGGAPPFAAAAKKCEDCGKEPCECPKKEATGPVAAAIQNLGGHVEGEEQEAPEAVKLAFATLQQYGYIE